MIPFSRCLTLLLLGVGSLPGAAAERPNILWITCEDTGPHLGCFGDRYSTTPHLDALAAKGMRYTRVWSTAPVCAPARTALISGMYPSSTGAEHMRSLVPLPAGAKMYPQVLRDAGYYCSNNSKEDYNLAKPDGVWDDSSNKAHYRNRRDGQPFFAVFNFTTTHESQVRARPHTPVHDPAKVRVPAYHPDTPEVRQDWAQYYDQITVMDGQAGRLLRELESEGRVDDTIVFFYGDHGPGMPRNKRCPYNSGLRVGLIVFIPEKYRALATADYRPGGESERLLGFVDFGPTVLSLAGVQPPAPMQGRPFLGRFAAEPARYVYGLRGRMDERYDLVRSVFDGRYVYLRNYFPHRPWGQHVAYMFETPTTQVWKAAFDAGTLPPAQAYFWQAPKAPEELYDLQSDPDEVRNLAGAAEHRAILERLRQAHQDWVRETRDIGFLPEGEIHARAQGGAPYDVARDDARYPLAEVAAMADRASRLDPQAVPELQRGLAARDSAVRYWAALGLLMRGPPAVTASAAPLRQALADPSPYVRIVAAESLGRFGAESDLAPALEVLLALADPSRNGSYVSTFALNSVDALGTRAQSRVETLRAMPRAAPGGEARASGYPGRMLTTILGKLDPQGEPKAAPRRAARKNAARSPE